MPLRPRAATALADNRVITEPEPVPLVNATHTARTRLKMYKFEDLEDWCEQIGERRARAKQIWKWLYGDGNWIKAFSDTQGKQDAFGKAFMERIPAVATCDGGLYLEKVATASDGTKKLIFEVEGGGRVETVLIPIVREHVRSSTR